MIMAASATASSPNPRTGLDHLSLKLSAEDMQEISTSMSKFVVYGDRMGKAHMSQIDYTI
jgi:hypothetical protein